MAIATDAVLELFRHTTGKQNLSVDDVYALSDRQVGALVEHLEEGDEIPSFAASIQRKKSQGGGEKEYFYDIFITRFLMADAVPATPEPKAGPSSAASSSSKARHTPRSLFDSEEDEDEDEDEEDDDFTASSDDDDESDDELLRHPKRGRKPSQTQIAAARAILAAVPASKGKKKKKTSH